MLVQAEETEFLFSWISLSSLLRQQILGKFRWKEWKRRASLISPFRKGESFLSVRILTTTQEGNCDRPFVHEILSVCVCVLYNKILVMTGGARWMWIKTI